MAQLTIDFASTDGVKPPDLSAAYAAGMRVGIPRGLFGRPLGGGKGCYQDPCWELNKDRFAPAKMQRTAYLFLCLPDPSYPGTTPQPEVQADQMFEYVKLTRGQDFPPCLDVEMDTSLLDNAAKLSWYNRACVRLTELYGVRPIIYWSDRVYREVLGNPTAAQAGPLGTCANWIAKPWPWPTRTPIHLDGAPQYQPNTIEALGDSTNWLWYQYQGDATKMPGFAGAVDANRTNVIAKGAKGTIVRFIQERLDGLVVDGDFGPATDAAVKKFQASWNLVPDGIVGNLTWAPLLWTAPRC